MIYHSLCVISAFIIVIFIIIIRQPGKKPDVRDLHLSSCMTVFAERIPGLLMLSGGNKTTPNIISITVSMQRISRNLIIIRAKMIIPFGLLLMVNIPIPPGRACEHVQDLRNLPDRHNLFSCFLLSGSPTHPTKYPSPMTGCIAT